MFSIIRASGFSSLAIGSILIGNYFYTSSSWKADHPLYNESIELLLRDQNVVRELGPKLKKGKILDGSIEPGKNWAKAEFEVEGFIKAKVTVIGDAKAVPDITTDDYPIKPYENYESTLATILNYFSPETPVSSELKWKITSLNVLIDDWVTLEVVNATDKQHKDMIKKEKLVDSEPKPELSVGLQRRKSQLKKITYVYWKLVPAALLTLFIGVYTSRFFKNKPVVNSLFFNKSFEILRMSEVAREHIGTPIQSFQCLKGNLNYNGTAGKVSYFVYGPMGFAKVEVVGKLNKKSKEWSINELVFEKDNKTYNVKK